MTVGEVAAAAGVGERTLYGYFSDNDDLLFGEDEQFRSTLSSALKQQPDGPPLVVLRGAGAAVARLLEDRRELGSTCADHRRFGLADGTGEG